MSEREWRQYADRKRRQRDEAKVVAGVAWRELERAHQAFALVMRHLDECELAVRNLGTTEQPMSESTDRKTIKPTLSGSSSIACPGCGFEWKTRQKLIECSRCGNSGYSCCSGLDNGLCQMCTFDDEAVR